jgi:GDPmannose 4,6-dehydratase
VAPLLNNTPKTALICGASGQDGAYLAALLLEKGYRVAVTSRDAETQSFANLRSLGILHRVEKLSMSLADFRSVFQALDKIQPDEVYNLSGQSSVGLSFQQPGETFQSITVAGINLLEAITLMKKRPRVYFAGSGECFGDTAGQAANEETPFKPRSPYATAKAAIHWAVVNYRESYGHFVCTGILFNHESPLRSRRFVTRKIVAAAVAIANGSNETLELGNISIQRDWGWAPEYVSAMWAMLQQDTPDDFVIATGVANSLQDFCAEAFAAVGLDYEKHVKINPALFRPAEISANRGDASKALAQLKWKATLTMPEVVRRMVATEQRDGG